MAIVGSFLRLSSKSIWPCVLFHAVNNAAMVPWPEQSLDNMRAATGIYLGIVAFMTAPFAMALWLRVRKIRRMTANCRQLVAPLPPAME